MGKEKKHKKDSSSKKGKKKHKSEKSSHSKRDRSPSSASEGEGMWVEKPAVVEIPQAQQEEAGGPSLPAVAQREDWMTDVQDFSSFGQKRRIEEVEKEETEKDREEKRRKAIRAERELNPYFKEGGSGVLDEPGATNLPTEDKPAPTGRSYEYGDNGANWRMMKLKRVYETAEAEGRSVQDVAMERYGSLEDFEEAKAERAFLDDRRSQKGRERRDDGYRPTVRSGASFQRPSEDNSRRAGRTESSRSSKAEDPAISSRAASTRPATVTSSAPAPPPTRIPSALPRNTPPTSNTQKVLSKDELNKLQSRVLKAKLMGLPDADALEKEYEGEKRRAEERGQVEKDTHDEHGNRLRYSAEEDKLGLNDLIMQERMASGADYDDVMANRIAGDVTFKNDLDYMDDSADRLSHKKSRTEEQKRARAVQDFRRSQSAQAKCSFCFQEEQKPRAQIAALGTKVYLAMPEVISMVPGHCLIVPVEHVLTTLECDDDAWDEIRNFQKCLIQMFSAENKGVIFMEQVINFKWQKHAVIECIPVPMEKWEDAPAYFKEAILSSEEEWSQHQKVIDTGKNGVRRSMVKNLPYFHVWFDPNRGYGHVIEGQEWREWFGREVIGSMLELPPDKWRRPRRMDPAVAGPRLKDFLGKWKPYDWTAMLDGGEY
ncbi:hypothetical protein HDV00_000655 [Rhizophlyctis rosea]|nr:hypothetical protein HDV00_000655 [Rhizophlyctis rosea]